MAIGMDALLKIRASVEGRGTVDALAGSLGVVSNKAQTVQKGFIGLTSSLGGVLNGFQLLAPLATGAGLISLAKRSIDAADGMNDLAQRTGLSVEALSRFRRPAALAGTDIESVAKALQKLSKGLMDGNGSAVQGLNSLGISARDSSGKLKATDQILLEIADKFKGMPDGIQKTGLAMQLFGKAGAEMIPMLNMGSVELGKFKGITTEYAQQADRAGDSMIMLQGKIGALGGQVATVLLPFMITATELLTGLVDGFTKLPGPIQVVIGAIAALAIVWIPLAGVISSTITVITALSALNLGAVIVGWAGAITPAIAGITVAFSGFITFLTSTILPALLGFFSGPAGWIALAVVAVVGMAIAFREPIQGFITWLGEALPQGFAIAWDAVKSGVNTTWEWLTARWTDLSNAFNSIVVNPITTAWNSVTNALPNAMQAAASTISDIWNNVINSIRSVINGFLSAMSRGINGIIQGVNRVIAAYNKLPGPDIPFVPTMGIPAFAKGGHVNGPTVALIGEGGEGESVVPDSKRYGFAMNVLAGKTGAAAIPGLTNAPYVQKGPMPAFIDGAYASSLPGRTRNNLPQGYYTSNGVWQEYERLPTIGVDTDFEQMWKENEAIRRRNAEKLAYSSNPENRKSSVSTIRIEPKMTPMPDGQLWMPKTEVEKMALQIAQQVVEQNNRRLRQPSTRRVMPRR